MKTLVFPKEPIKDEVSLKSEVYKYLEQNPNTKITTLYSLFPNTDKHVLQEYKYLFRRDCKLRQLGPIDWKLLKGVLDIILYKMVPTTPKMAMEDKDALNYFKTLVEANYKG